MYGMTFVDIFAIEWQLGQIVLRDLNLVFYGKKCER